MIDPGAVWLDAQGAQNPKHLDRGIPRYVAEHARALVDLDDRGAIGRVVVDRGLPLTSTLVPLAGSGRLVFTDTPPADPPRLYHVMSPFELERPLAGLWPSWARASRTRLVMTVYDVIPQLFPDVYLTDRPTRTRYQSRLAWLRRADHVLAISQATAADTERIGGVPADRITVIDAGVSTSFAGAHEGPEQALRSLERRLPNLRPGFALYVGGFDPRKNMERLIAAWGLLAPAVRREHQLVITCRLLPEELAVLRRAGDAAGLTEDELIITGYVTDPELAALYHSCLLFVFASYYEGSGLPILEAMSVGLPVVASAASTTPEILGDDEGTFDPHDEHDMARVIAQALTDAPLRERLRERSRRRSALFTWQHVARRSLEGYDKALARPTRGRRRRRPRVALVTPWPPTESGVATYSGNLAAALAQHADLDVVVDGVAADRPAPPGARLLPANAFRTAAALRNYDRVVHCMGNSAFHGHVYELLREHGGTVLLHDVRLTGFFGWYAGQEHPIDPVGRLGERLRHAYPDRIGPGGYAHQPPDWTEQLRLGLMLAGELAHHTQRFVVHSRHAADLLAADLRGPRPPVDVIPHAFPSPAPASAADRNGAHVVSFGIVSTVKGTHRLLDAFALVHAERPDSRLTFAGGGEPSELAELRDRIDALNLRDAVTVTGYLDDVAWATLFREATLAVQLRETTNGETSGTIVECLAAGLPVIGTAMGWPRELPAEMIELVPLDVTSPALADAIARALDDPDGCRTRALAGLEHAAAWSFDRVARRLLEVMGT